MIDVNVANGSSPRLWGTHGYNNESGVQVRFIPTAVGNALIKYSFIFLSPVHPHGCGERRLLAILFHPRFGSSPRLWGTLHHPPIPVGHRRFIPTAVGNAVAPLPWFPHAPVHPHGCGERSFSTYRRQFNDGSSPRLWGTLCRDV